MTTPQGGDIPITYNFASCVYQWNVIMTLIEEERYVNNLNYVTSLGLAWVSPTCTSKWNGGFLIYVCLDQFNTTAHCMQTISNIFTLTTAQACCVGEDSKERHLGEVSGAWMLTVRGRLVLKTNLATYRTQKVANSWIADSVFITRSDFLISICVLSSIIFVSHYFM